MPWVTIRGNYAAQDNTESGHVPGAGDIPGTGVSEPVGSRAIFPSEPVN